MTKEKANRNEVVGMFLTYCRKTLVNARTDVLRERKRRRNREVLFCDLRRSELESLADWQDVPERETVFDAAGKPIGVTDKDLADALEKLCPEEQAIFLRPAHRGSEGECTGEGAGQLFRSKCFRQSACGFMKDLWAGWLRGESLYPDEKRVNVRK